MNHNKYIKLYTEDKKCQFCGKYDIPPYRSTIGRWEDYSMVCDGVQTWGPDPFAEEIGGDTSDYLMCDGQRYEAAMDI